MPPGIAAIEQEDDWFAVAIKQAMGYSVSIRSFCIHSRDLLRIFSAEVVLEDAELGGRPWTRRKEYGEPGPFLADLRSTCGARGTSKPSSIS